MNLIECLVLANVILIEDNTSIVSLYNNELFINSNIGKKISISIVIYDTIIADTGNNSCNYLSLEFITYYIHHFNKGDIIESTIFLCLLNTENMDLYTYVLNKENQHESSTLIGKHYF